VKKFLLLAPVLLLFAFAACDSNGNNEPEPTTATPTIPATVAQTTAPPTTHPPTEEEDIPPAPLTANITIRSITDPHLPAFETYPTEIDFVALRIAAGTPAEYFEWVDHNWGIVIIADEPLYDLQIITMGHNWEAYPLTTFIAGVLDEIDVLPAGTPLILSRFFLSGGVMPMEGISFTDSTGVRRNMGIMDNRRDDDPPYFLIEFADVGE